MQEDGTQYVDAASGRPAGVIQYSTFEEGYTRVRCLHHDNCSFFVIIQLRCSEKLTEAVRWIRRATETTRQEHVDAAVAYKQMFGIRARRR